LTTKKPKDFKITGESGVKTIEEPFFGPETEIPAESRLTHAILETRDYRNEKCLSLTFERYSSEGVLPIYRDTITFYRTQAALEIIGELERLTQRLQKFCVDRLDPDRRHED